MSGSVNKVILIGRLGKDPEIRAGNTGDRIASLSLATSESWKDRTTGEKRERTEWHRIVIFNDGLVGVIERFCKKGSQIHIEGQLQTRKWAGNDGVDRYTTEVVLTKFKGELTLLGDPAGGERAPAPTSQDDYGRPAAGGRAKPQPEYDPDLNDQIPF